jgi:hypothetical protein
MRRLGVCGALRRSQWWCEVVADGRSKAKREGVLYEANKTTPHTTVDTIAE